VRIVAFVRHCVVSGVLALSAAAPALAADAAPLQVIDQIPGPDGGYDYVSIDAKLGRVFVAREHGVMAIDVATRKVTPSLVAAEDVAEVLPLPHGRTMLATAYGEDSIVLFDRTTGAVQHRLRVGRGPDAAVYDPSSKLAVVMNGGSQDVALIDLNVPRVVATVPVGSHPEAAVADGHGHVYVNVEDRAEVLVIDTAARTATRRIPLPKCIEPTAIAYDAISNVLISACHNSTTKLIDADSGRDVATVATGRGADGAVFDPAHRTAYVSAIDGTLTRFEIDVHGQVTNVTHIATAHGARTVALDPTTGRLYLPTRDTRPNAQGKPVAVPGTFRVLVVGTR
jgi:YVTN family beta-propeller protein